MSYIAFEASGLLVNGVLIRRGFPNQFRTSVEGDGSYLSGRLFIQEGHSKGRFLRLDNDCG